MGKPSLRRIDVGSVLRSLPSVDSSRNGTLSGMRFGVGKDSVPPRSSGSSPMMCRPHPTRDTTEGERRHHLCLLEKRERDRERESTVPQ